MSDTPTQAAARLLELAKAATPGPYLMAPADEWRTDSGKHAQWGRYDISTGSTDIEAEDYYRIASVSNVNGAVSNGRTAELLTACDPATITTLCTALQEACAERDALRAKLRASEARLFEVRDLLHHRPALNAGTLEAYIRWTNEVVKLDWLDAIDGARKEGA